MTDGSRAPAPDAGRGGGPAGGGRRRSRSAGGEKGRPEPVRGIVGAVLGRLGIAEKVERAGAAAEWDELVGPHIARVTRRRWVSGRTLFVEVESAAWLSELNMMRRHLLRKVNEGRGEAPVEKIVFIQAGGGSGDPPHGRSGGPAGGGSGGPEGRRWGSRYG